MCVQILTNVLVIMDVSLNVVILRAAMNASVLQVINYRLTRKHVQVTQLHLL